MIILNNTNSICSSSETCFIQIIILHSIKFVSKKNIKYFTYIIRIMESLERNIKISPTKLLILYNKLFHYRIPLFNLIADKYELTVAYSIESNLEEYEHFKYNFKIIKLPIIKYKYFILHTSNIYKLCSGFDVIIIYGDIKWIKFSLIPFFKNRKFKTIFWTIGTSSNKGFDKNRKWDKIRDLIYKRADAIIFYSEYPINKYLKRGFSKSQLFVAHNTIEVIETFGKIDKDKKDSILFIGTLQKRKGILLLLNAYYLAFEKESNLPNLNIVGNGEEMENIKKWIADKGLLSKITLLGSIYKKNEKINYFQKAIVCISPKQAGLSVLESMGYGVPFITFKDAITGGEIYNIKNNINGIILETQDELEKVIIDLFHNKEKYIKMGENALEFYNNNRKLINTVNSIYAAIDYVINKKK